jgi:vacuolar-type H+-ATPase subunit I/STV1
MYNITTTNKSIVDNLLDKFVVENPKELEFAIEALKSMTDTKGSHAVDESFQDRIQEIKQLIKKPPTKVTSEQILEKISAKINELSQKALIGKKEFNIKTEEVEIPSFTDDLEENKQIYKALLKLRKHEKEQLKSEKEALQLYAKLEGRSSLDSKERFDAFTSVSDFLENDNEPCLLLMGDADAFVGDTLLSIIKTCALNSINPYDYLVAIQANVDEVRKHPDAWLPWNYSENAKMPYVQSQSIPAEEVYQTNPTGPPITTPIIQQPDLEACKPTLRERARDFFKNMYPKKWKQAAV